MKDYSQNGESIYLSSLFPKDYLGVCVEVGASDGTNLSNTYYFEQKGWDTMCIEPIEDLYLKCKATRKLAINCAVSSQCREENIFSVFTLSNSDTSTISSLQPDERLIQTHAHLITNITKVDVRSRTLTELLDENNYPCFVDIISIDTGNTELDVLRGLDLTKYEIKAFVIHNYYEENFCENYLRTYGYKKIKRMGMNDIFVKPTNFAGLKDLSNVSLSVSPGEALDKYSILKLKAEFINNPTKADDIKFELSEIFKTIEPLLQICKTEYENLYAINKKIWISSDKIRGMNDIEDKEYIQLLIDIHKDNDQRFAYKSEINTILTSGIKEHKGYEDNTVTYEAGGLLGDFFLSLYVIKAVYEATGKRGILQISDNFAEPFRYPLEKTYEDLIPIIKNQKYIKGFTMENINAKTNLSKWRMNRHRRLYRDNWIDLYNGEYNLQTPKQIKWIQHPIVNSFFVDKIVVHLQTYSPLQIPKFLDDIIKSKRCIFILNKADVPHPSYKDETTYVIKNLEETATVINSCKLFIGTCSAPLALAYAMQKPALGYLNIDAAHYINMDKYNPEFFWYVNENQKHLDGICDILNSCSPR